MKGEAFAAAFGSDERRTEAARRRPCGVPTHVLYDRTHCARTRSRPAASVLLATDSHKESSAHRIHRRLGTGVALFAVFGFTWNGAPAAIWFRWLSNRFPAMVEGRLHAPNLMRTLVIHLTVWAQAACGRRVVGLQMAASAVFNTHATCTCACVQGKVR